MSALSEELDMKSRSAARLRSSRTRMLVQTTLTEKLPHGGAIHLAGPIKSRVECSAMRNSMETAARISVTSSVLQFDYDGCQHQHPHYQIPRRTPNARHASSTALSWSSTSRRAFAAQTKKLKVCKQRGIPIFTFVNKLDHYGSAANRPLAMTRTLSASVRTR